MGAATRRLVNPRRQPENVSGLLLLLLLLLLSSCWRAVLTGVLPLPAFRPSPAATPSLAAVLILTPLSFSCANPPALSLPGPCAVADYDGVVSQVDMESGHLIAEVDEHDGRRCAMVGCQAQCALIGYEV